MIIFLASLLTFVSCAVGSTRGSAAHALYIGMVELHFPEAGNVANLRVKVFRDDLQSAVRAALPARYRPAPKEKEWITHNREAVIGYFRQKLEFSSQHTILKYKMVASSRENDLYLLDFTLQCPQKWQTLQLRADFFTELFPTQSNIIRWEKGKGEASFARTSRNAPVIQIINR